MIYNANDYFRNGIKYAIKGTEFEKNIKDDEINQYLNVLNGFELVPYSIKKSELVDEKIYFRLYNTKKNFFIDSVSIDETGILRLKQSIQKDIYYIIRYSINEQNIILINDDRKGPNKEYAGIYIITSKRESYMDNPYKEYIYYDYNTLDNYKEYNDDSIHYFYPIEHYLEDDLSLAKFGFSPDLYFKFETDPEKFIHNSEEINKFIHNLSYVETLSFMNKIIEDYSPSNDNQMSLILK